MANYPKKRAPIACDVCRARRTKCDGQKPRCDACQRTDAECVYQPGAGPSKLEVDIATINEQLDHITTLLEGKRQSSSESSSRHERRESRTSLVTTTTKSDADTHDPDFPTMAIKCESTMRLLNLDPELGTRLSDLERTSPVPSRSSRPGLAKTFMLHPQRVASATAAFAENIHCWFPFLPEGYSKIFTAAFSGYAQSEVETCVGVLILAIGSLAEKGPGHGAVDERPDALYFDEALPLLPMVIGEYSLPSLYSLMLFGLYYLCLMRPCQAHDYILMASNKCQNMIKSMGHRDDPTHTESVQRAYWAVFLIEDELKAQLDMVGSGIQRCQDMIPLPSSDGTWYHHAAERAPPPALAPAATCLDGPYLLARVTMQRLLRYCMQAGGRSGDGSLYFAPEAAKTLELRLEEWFEALPSDLKSKRPYRHGEATTATPRALFLKTHYAAYKVFIYWPAAYLAIERGGLGSDGIAQGCRSFLEAYILLVEVATVTSSETCLPHAWTLTTSIFIITMCALKAAKVASLQQDTVSIFQGAFLEAAFLQALEAVKAVSVRSPSLAVLHNILAEAVQRSGIEE